MSRSMRRCGAMSPPRMSATPPRSCSPTWRRRSPARSCTSTRASATSSPGSAHLLPALLLLQISAVDLDVGAALQARDVSLELCRADQVGRARLGLLLCLLVRCGLAFHHLADAQDDVAGLADRHADIGR